MRSEFYVPNALRSNNFSLILIRSGNAGGPDFVTAGFWNCLKLCAAFEPFGEASDANREGSGWLII